MSERTLFSLWLKEQRTTLGVSKARLAEQLNCTAQLLDRLESGEQRPGRRMAEALADLFRVPPSERTGFILFAVSDIDHSFDADGRGENSGEAEVELRLDAPWRLLSDPPNNLPAQVTSFVRRASEVQQVVSLLRSPEVRLLTLTGPPGIGKTRLALEVASRVLDQYEDGVFFVPLASISEPSLVEASIASALSANETPTQPTFSTLEELLRNKSMLLVLDNFEHVMEAAVSVARLLTTCRALRVLTTSRAALCLYGESVFVVPALGLPGAGEQLSVEDLAQWEATDLFVQRAHAANSNLRLTDENAPIVADIVRRLDGLPLAIELAAAHARVFSVEDLQSRLGNRLDLLVSGGQNLSPRQQTLRRAISWSYGLLSDDEQRAFRHVAIFQGGGSLEAIEQVLGSESDAFRLVTSLVDKSLVRRDLDLHGGLRFSMLETLREYALEQVRLCGEELELRHRHSMFVLEFVERAEPHLTGPDREAWLARIEAELDNVRSALIWLLGDKGNAERGARLAAALHWFWYFRSHYSEGATWLGYALERGQTSLSDGTRAKLLYATGRLAEHTNDRGTARKLLEESLDLFRSTADPRGSAYALAPLARIGAYAGEEALHARIHESLTIFKETGDEWGLAYAQDVAGDVFYVLGDIESASAHKRASLWLYRRLADRQSTAYALGQVGLIAVQQRDFDLARACFDEAVPISELAGDRWNVAVVKRGAGMVAHLQGDYELAWNAYSESYRLFEDLGDRGRMGGVLRNLAQVALRQGKHTDALALFREALLVHTNLEQQWGACLALGGLAGVAATSNPELAARLLGAAIPEGQASHRTMSSADLAEYEHNTAVLRESIGAKRLRDCCAQGSALSLTEAIELSFSVKPPARAAHAATPANSYPCGLTRREVELLRLLALGLSNADLAQRLYLSAHTVRAHLYSIYGKINVSSRTAAAHFAIEHKLI